MGRLYLDPLSWLAQILQYVQVNVRSLAPKRRQFSLLRRPPPRNDKLEILKSLVRVLQLKKNFGSSYVQRTTPASSPDISPGLGLSSSINYILYAQVNLITRQNYAGCQSLQIKYTKHVNRGLNFVTSQMTDSGYFGKQLCLAYTQRASSPCP